MTETEPQLPRCVVTLNGFYVEHHNSSIDQDTILGTPIAPLILSPGGWEKISAYVQQHGTTTLEYAFKKPGLEKNCWHGVAKWSLKGDFFHGVMLHQFDVTRAWLKGEYRVKDVEIVTNITSIADIYTDGSVKIGHNTEKKPCVPRSLPPMTLHESLRVAAQNAFHKLPLFAHKEILEVSIFEASDKIRIYCQQKEDAIALHQGRWDIVSSAVSLYPQTEFELYYQGKDQSPRLYRAFSVKEAAISGRLQRREVQKMIDSVQGGGNGNGLLLPKTFSFNDIYSSVFYSPDKVTMVAEQDSKPIIVSQPYAEWTRRTVIDWVGDSEGNKAGWAPGELARMQRYLEQDGHLHNFEYQAYLHDFGEPMTWFTSFQRVYHEGQWLRVAKILDVVKANLVTV